MVSFNKKANGRKVEERIRNLREAPKAQWNRNETRLQGQNTQR